MSTYTIPREGREDILPKVHGSNNLSKSDTKRKYKNIIDIANNRKVIPSI